MAHQIRLFVRCAGEACDREGSLLVDVGENSRATLSIGHGWHVAPVKMLHDEQLQWLCPVCGRRYNGITKRHQGIGVSRGEGR